MRRGWPSTGVPPFPNRPRLFYPRTLKINARLARLLPRKRQRVYEFKIHMDDKWIYRKSGLVSANSIIDRLLIEIYSKRKSPCHSGGCGPMLVIAFGGDRKNEQNDSHNPVGGSE